MVGVLAVAGAVVARYGWVYSGDIGPYVGIVILVTALVALLSGMAASVGWPRSLAAAASVMAIGAAAEILGLYARIPFGRYAYSDWWRPSVILPRGEVFPLLLPVTWFLIVAGSYLVVARRIRGWALIPAAAAMAALVDLTFEAVLTRVVGFWTWLEPTPLLGAPYGNFLGWLLVAAAAAACLHALRVERAAELPHPPAMLALGLVSTAVIGVTHGEPRGLVALALLPVVLWLGRGDRVIEDRPL